MFGLKQVLLLKKTLWMIHRYPQVNLNEIRQIEGNKKGGIKLHILQYVVTSN